MKSSNQIYGKDWLHYHPYSSLTFVDNYYINLCNKVLKIIRQSEIGECTDSSEEEKRLACLLVAYFEDVISETRLFSAFTRQHKKMYYKELPFYKITDEYYDDEINVEDIYFLIWYYVSVRDKETLVDPYFDNCQEFGNAVLEIYNLFDSEFETAPQNEKMQQFLQLSPGANVREVREKLSFIAHNSFLWKDVFDIYFDEALEEYKKDGVVVLTERANVAIYDSKVQFIYDNCMPLLAMRINEYFAEVLGEEHQEYQFIKNISKRIMGCFLIRKIEKDGYLIEHLTSKKQLWLSNEFTSFENLELIENDTILSICLVEWKDNVWQNQGACAVSSIRDMEGKDVSEHLFDDESRKIEFVRKQEEAFLEITNGQRVFYVEGCSEFIEFQINLMRKHAKITKPDITDEELDEKYNGLYEKMEYDLPFEDNEALCLFYNPKCGVEIYRCDVTFCMSDKNNPHYMNHEFDFGEMLTNVTFSTEFVNYVIENDLIELQLDDYYNTDLMSVVLENLDFLLRFYRRSKYFTKPEVTLTKS